MGEDNSARVDAFHLPDDPTPTHEAIYTPAVTPSHCRDVFRGIHHGRWTRPLPGDICPRQLDFLDPENSLFRISHVLYSAGQALNVNGDCIVTERDRTKTRAILDSGGFQIATKKLPINGDADRLRILRWQERHADLAIVLDVPPGPIARGVAGYRYETEADCLRATLENLDFIVANRRSGDVQFLNVLQGNDQHGADVWYNEVKNKPFEGWAIAGPLRHNMFELTRRFIIMLDEGKLGDRPRWIHILGTAELDAAVMLTGLQGILNEIGAQVRISFDTAGPFRLLANRQVYTLPHLTKLSMTMGSANAPDGRVFMGSEVRWPWPSPIGDLMMMGDICAKEPTLGRSFSDSLSYALQANHNLAAMCFGIAQANRVFGTESLDHNHSVGRYEGAAVQAMRKALQAQSMGVLLRQQATFKKLRHRHNHDEGRETVPDPE
jgi:hypothetical protein